jgi:hypothetical protein
MSREFARVLFFGAMLLLMWGTVAVFAYLMAVDSLCMSPSRPTWRQRAAAASLAALVALSLAGFWVFTEWLEGRINP